MISPQHPKRDQNLKFTPLKRDDEHPHLFYIRVLPHPPVVRVSTYRTFYCTTTALNSQFPSIYFPNTKQHFHRIKLTPNNITPSLTVACYSDDKKLINTKSSFFNFTLILISYFCTKCNRDCHSRISLHSHNPRGGGGYSGILVTGMCEWGEIGRRKKILQARPWPKKCSTAQNVTQKKSN